VDRVWPEFDWVDDEAIEVGDPHDAQPAPVFRQHLACLAGQQQAAPPTAAQRASQPARPIPDHQTGWIGLTHDQPHLQRLEVTQTVGHLQPGIQGGSKSEQQHNHQC